MNIRSIGASWIIALCLLGIISLLKQPSLAEGEDSVIKIPAEKAPRTEEQFSELKAKVWCALDGYQTAMIQFQGQTRQLTGAMAIAPQWDGNELSPQQEKLLAPCVQQRLDQLAERLQSRHHEQPVMDYLFTQL